MSTCHVNFRGTTALKKLAYSRVPRCYLFLSSLLACVFSWSVRRLSACPLRWGCRCWPHGMHGITTDLRSHGRPANAAHGAEDSEDLWLGARLRALLHRSPADRVTRGRNEGLTDRDWTQVPVNRHTVSMFCVNVCAVFMFGCSVKV